MTKKLVDVANPDNLIGYEGNYMIFPLKKLNYLHMYMMMPYVEERMGMLALEKRLRLGDFTTDEYIDYLKCVYASDPADFELKEAYYKDRVLKRLTGLNNEKQIVVVPANSLFIEALPGTHTIMEDFKLLHRAVDVKKAQAEATYSELENIPCSQGI